MYPWTCPGIREVEGPAWGHTGNPWQNEDQITVQGRSSLLPRENVQESLGGLEKLPHRPSPGPGGWTRIRQCSSRALGRDPSCRPVCISAAVEWCYLLPARWAGLSLCIADATRPAETAAGAVVLGMIRPSQDGKGGGPSESRTGRLRPSRDTRKSKPCPQLPYRGISAPGSNQLLHL